MEFLNIRKFILYDYQCGDINSIAVILLKLLIAAVNGYVVR